MMAGMTGWMLRRGRLVAALAVGVVAVGCGWAQPDRSAHFPPGWGGRVLMDSEEVAGWHPVAGATDSFEVFTVSRSTEARARGQASCRLQLRPKPGRREPAIIESIETPAERCAALSVWLKNPEGAEGAVSFRVVDADGVEYSSEAQAIGAERNWYEIAAYLGDFNALSPDPRPGVDLPLRAVRLAFCGLEPGKVHVLYVDELACHVAPLPKVDLIELRTPGTVAAGDNLAVNLRLRAQSEVKRAFSLRVTVQMGEATGAATEVRVAVPVEGAQAGTVLEPLEVRVPISRWWKPGEALIGVESRDVEVTVPDAEQLATRKVTVTRGEESPTGCTVELQEGVPVLTARGLPVRWAVWLRRAESSELSTALPEGTLVRFPVVLGEGDTGQWAAAAKALWRGPDAYDFSGVDAALQNLASATGHGLLVPDILLDCPGWWVEAHREDTVTLPTPGGVRREPSFCSTAWRADASTALAALVKHIETGPLADAVAGYIVSWGSEGRWLQWEVVGWPRGDGGPTDTTRAQRDALGSWLQQRYGRLEALRSAWGQPVLPAPGEHSVPAITDWAEARLPARLSSTPAGTWILDPVAWTPLTDWRLFSSQAVVDCLGQFTAAVKAACGGRKACGAAYGHFLELASRNGGLEAGGHLGLRAALELRDLDFLIGPTPREGSLLMPAQAVHRAGKVLVTGPAAEGARGAWETAAAAAEANAVPCFPASAAEVGQAVASLTPGESTAEVAVVFHPESLALLGPGNPVKRPLLTGQMEELRKLGAPVDAWLLDDLLEGRTPTYKVVIFPGVMQLDEREVRQLRAVLGRMRAMAVWIGAPGAAGVGLSARQVKQLTGITVTMDMDPAPLDARPVASGYGSEAWGVSVAVSPRFVPVDGGAQVVARDSKERPALVLKRQEGWVSAYSTAPGVPASVLRGLLGWMHARFYDSSGGALYANARMVGVMGGAGGPRTVQLPGVADVWEVEGERKIAAGSPAFIADVPAGTLRLYRVEPLR